MESLTELYKVGSGPSSSHTIGPERACLLAARIYPQADAYRVILYGSLAKTGRGHGTDTIIKKTLAPLPCDITFDCETKSLPHPNTMDLYAMKDGRALGQLRIMSVGGGRIQVLGEAEHKPVILYEHKTFNDIRAYCEEHGLRLWQFAERFEGPDFWEYMREMWDAMKHSIKQGLADDGILPGGLNVQKKANFLYHRRSLGESSETRENRLVCSYAFAVSEQNAAGEKIVTAPTCGAAGVLPAVLYYEQHKNGFEDEEVVRALASGGIIGNVIKTNASISGAECGCQAEIGTACAMAAAALGELFQLNLDKIEYAAEIAIEHHLGLTCDPVCGLVQIPCIERNAVAAMRAINAVTLSDFLCETRKVSFDKVVQAMKETGRDMSTLYKETSEGGLATVGVHHHHR
ncbi:MAG: L-serine ammonia-lyase, iron-sulfur-dependent, subunit alpha [Clostridia bacterium]|nr:L-serine ammonia-lyase, iron-sulfur-dependent, subunit alpha [Clostridia bacterium]